MFIAGADYSALILDRSLTIAFFLTVAYAVPAALWFRGRYGYFVLFIPVLWVPLSVIVSLPIVLLPARFNHAAHSEGVYVFIWLLHASSVALGVALGISARGLKTLALLLEKRRLRKYGQTHLEERREETEQ